MSSLVERVRRRLARPDPAGTMSADPGERLERAIADAREQHRLVTSQAAEIVATHTQQRHRLERTIAAYEEANASARGAVRQADAAAAAGDADEAARWEATAESLADRILSLEREIEDRRGAVLDAAAAADRARGVVEQSATALRVRLLDLERMAGSLDQARLHEQLNEALRLLSLAPAGGTETTDQVRRAIAERLATAQALTEIRSEPSDPRRVELERELARIDAQARVADLRRGLADDPDPGSAQDGDP